MTENRHAKFAAYWESLGKPPIEVKSIEENDTDFEEIEHNPCWIKEGDYRIAGDRHWKLRLDWINSDFKLRIEYRDSIDASWLPVGVPTWSAKFDYRAAPEQDILEEIATGYPGKIIHVVETKSFTGEGATVSLGIDPAEPGSDRTVIAEAKTDPGAHYRYTYHVRLTEADKANGYVDVKLDPARICEIYGASRMMQQFVIKKGLRAGRGHKSLLQDIRDIHNALDRWEEMLKEDGVL